VQTRIGAIDRVDVAALVGLDIVRLNRSLAAILALDSDATRISRLRSLHDHEHHKLYR
jgi:hypothetical protein